MEIVRRGLLPSREQARTAIDAGTVVVGGAPATKASRLVGPDEAIRVLGPGPRYVSRAGDKLHGALDHFAVAVAGRRALDVGASTGGFTDCLLQHGATSVDAVDVGRNQLHERLRADPRVRSREQADIRSVPPGALGPPHPLVTVDVSFISLRTVADAVLAHAAAGADLVLLVKPQFEAGRAVVSRGRGVVRDPAAWAGALAVVASSLTDRGAAIMGAMVSPLRGSDGNVEFFFHAVAPGAAPVPAGVDVAAAIEDVVAEAGAPR